MQDPGLRTLLGEQISEHFPRADLDIETSFSEASDSPVFVFVRVGTQGSV